MTRANLSFLNSTYDDINLMPVSYEYFAQYSSLYGRAYGVVTGEERGITGPDEDTFQTFVANNCLRNALYQGLLRVSRQAEEAVGYKLSTRYLVVEPMWRGSPKLGLRLPGIEAVEVERNWYPIEENNTFELNYYAEENLILEADGDVILARVSATIFENPRFAYLKNISNSNQLLRIDENHARYAELDSGDWLLPILTNITPVNISDTLSAFHQRQVNVVVTKPTIPTGAELKPVYPVTNQIVPHEVIDEDDSTVTYRFPIWTLVQAQFADEDIDWRRFPVYKFYPELELRYVIEEAAYVELIWTEGDDQYVYQYDPEAEDADDLPRLKVVLADGERGIVHLYMNDQLAEDLSLYWWRVCSCKRRKMPESVVVRIPVKATVAALPDQYRLEVDMMREAVMAKVAAELPVEDCGCKNKVGYIFQQQQPYGNAYVNPFTGVEVVKTDYGQRHGQRIYEDMLYNARIYRKPVRLGR